LKFSQWDLQNINHTICHQVGKRHQTLLYERLNLDITKNISTFEFLGNTGSVALPITLSHALELQKIQKSQKLALLGIGSGISSIVLGIES
jgi:3-oxoacyl-[acyl-carrier-protein] synthase-3